MLQFVVAKYDPLIWSLFILFKATFQMFSFLIYEWKIGILLEFFFALNLSKGNIFLKL